VSSALSDPTVVGRRGVETLISRRKHSRSELICLQRGRHRGLSRTSTARIGSTMLAGQRIDSRVNAHRRNRPQRRSRPGRAPARQPSVFGAGCPPTAMRSGGIFPISRAPARRTPETQTGSRSERNSKLRGESEANRDRQPWQERRTRPAGRHRSEVRRLRSRSGWALLPRPRESAAFSGMPTGRGSEASAAPD